jgi:RNA polymerase primary sigma factor
MVIHDFHKGDDSWRGVLSRTEAKVMSTAEERRLLFELVDCRNRILEALSRPADTAWSSYAAEADFQRRVRQLASSEQTHDSLVQKLGPVARRYEDVRTKLAMANVRLVAHVAKRYRDRGISPADLVQEGFCALLLAIDRFDLVNETRLATYAVWWIRQAIQRVVAASAYPVRLNPRQLHNLARAQEEAVEHDWDQSARATKPSTGRAQTLDRLRVATRPAMSLDSRSRCDGTMALLDFLARDQDDDTETDDAPEYLGDMFEVLDPRERVVLKLRFGLNGEPRQTLIQVSHVLGVSKERVRQLQDRALKKIRSSKAGNAFQTRFELSRRRGLSQRQG